MQTCNCGCCFAQNLFESKCRISYQDDYYSTSVLLLAFQSDLTIPLYSQDIIYVPIHRPTVQLRGFVSMRRTSGVNCHPSIFSLYFGFLAPPIPNRSQLLQLMASTTYSHHPLPSSTAKATLFTLEHKLPRHALVGCYIPLISIHEAVTYCSTKKKKSQ